MLFYVHGFKKTVYLIYALLSRIKFCRDYALFKGHFWPKFDGRGHGNILKDRALRVTVVKVDVHTRRVSVLIGRYQTTELDMQILQI